MYTFLLTLVTWFIRLINGKPIIKNLDRLPDDTNFMVVAPHRTVLDPVMLAIGAYPKKLSFIAKKELFENKFGNFLLPRIHAVPIDRDNPSKATIKQAVQTLKDGELNVGIFPTGSRFSSEVKSGPAMMAKMADKPIVPMTYQGPLTIKGLFSRKPENRMKINVGHPILLPDKKRLSKEDYEVINQQIAQALLDIDAELDPNYHYDPKEALKAKEAKEAKK